MDKLAHFIVAKRKIILITFIICTAVSAALVPFIQTNYDMSKYIPDYTQTKKGLHLMEKEFGPTGMARLMVEKITLPQAKLLKDQLLNIEGVSTVTWLDDFADPYQPPEFIDPEILRDYYKENSAIYDITFEENDASLVTGDAIDKIKKAAGENSYMSGPAVDTKSMRETTEKQVAIVTILLIPLTVAILLFTTTSWFEPVLFMCVIGVSVLLNMGTNLLLGEISFLTLSLSSALQLAIAMDYSIFLLHRFEVERHADVPTTKAMENAIKHSFTSIISSSFTTIAGFVALTLMEFSIGRDMGLVFAKGITLSLVSVIFLMPALILKFYDKVEKTRHRLFIPPFRKLAHGSIKYRHIMIVIIVILVIPSYFAQKENHFLYGDAALGCSEGTVVFEEDKLIRARFGRSTPLLLMVPNGDPIREKALVDQLEELDEVRNVHTICNIAPEGMPDSFLPVDKLEHFRSDDYTRMVIYLKTSSESDLAFEAIKRITTLAENYYGESYYTTGAIMASRDTKVVIEDDYGRVSMLSLVAIGMILLFTFNSWLLPFLLIAVIQSAIYINMAITYFSGESLIFMGYLIINSVQLGATIDYAILVTNKYLDNRATYDKKHAAMNAIEQSGLSILTSAGILSAAGFLINGVSTISAISQMGLLIGRGAFLSALLVLFFLPQILMIFDHFIHKTTFKRPTLGSLFRKKQSTPVEQNL